MRGTTETITSATTQLIELRNNIEALQQVAAFGRQADKYEWLSAPTTSSRPEGNVPGDLGAARFLMVLERKLQQINKQISRFLELGDGK